MVGSMQYGTNKPKLMMAGSHPDSDYPRSLGGISLGRIFLLFVIAASSMAVSAQSGGPKLEKVSATPSLISLAATSHGRMQTTQGAGDSVESAASWPGASFEAAFKGKEVYFRVGQSHEILHVVVDGQSPISLVNPEDGIYRLSGLQDRTHDVSVFVVTESAYFFNHFGGFSIPSDEKALPPPQARRRQIEFIGDSHTVGYGNLSSKRDCTMDEVWAETDNSQAFGPLTADHYGADYQVNAISGRGVVRNYDGSAGDTLPQVYPYTTFEKKQVYDDPKWKPQVIVVALGTNDFATQLHAGEQWKTRDELDADYEAKYVGFLKSLREKNRKAYVVLWATGLFNGEIETEVQKVVLQAKAQGEGRISFVPVDHLAFEGCHFHPSVADDKLIRDKLIQTIDSVPQVWQD